MNSKQDSKKVMLYLMLFQTSFFVIGLLLAYWYGIGWFILFHTVRVLFTSVPRIYFTIVKFLFGPKFADDVKVGLSHDRQNQLSTRYSTFINVFNVGLTILVFWKINIPLYVIVQMLFFRK